MEDMTNEEKYKQALKQIIAAEADPEASYREIVEAVMEIAEEALKETSAFTNGSES